MISNEVWKIYQKEGVFDEKTKLEFSIYGEVKSYNVLSPKGRIIKGSLQEGYPIIRFKRFGEMNDDAKQIIESFSTIISDIRSAIKSKKQQLLKFEGTVNQEKKLHRELESLKLDLAKNIKNLSKERQKINKKRTVYHHILIHKAVAELFLPNNDPEKIYVMHKNFDKQDNRVENLQWATKEEINQHSFRSPNWVKHNLELERSDKPRRQYSKLNYNDVVLIKRKLDKGEPMSRLARRYGVSDMQIHRIKTGENWGDVKMTLLDNKK